MEQELIITKARQHNLKNVSVRLPKNKLIVFTGVSGSGKSSLAFDTIYAEGQRRYVESLSSYARQFLGIMDKPDVDSIVGLSPSISIDQKSTSHNPRSTVGTVTEIYDYLRLLYARIGHPHCYNCGKEISRLTPEQIVPMIFDVTSQYQKEHGKKSTFGCIFAPIVRDRKGEFTNLLTTIRKKGYFFIRIDGIIYNLDDDIVLLKTNKHTIDVLIDRITMPESKKIETAADIKGRIKEAIDQALLLSQGYVTWAIVGDATFTFPDKPKKMEDTEFSEHFSCPTCRITMPELEPRYFSFNSPHGACPDCSGLGTILTVEPDLIMKDELSITEGGIVPFANMFFHDTWFSRVVTTVANEEGIDIRKPLKLLTEKQKKHLLFGTGDTLYTVSGNNRFGEHTTIQESYIGIIPELKKRHSETQSSYVREEIEKFMRKELCKTCNGARLKKETLTVTVDDFSIADVTQLSIKDALVWMRSIIEDKKHIFSERERIICTPIGKEIETRLTFLMDVGLQYLSLHRSATTLSGGEAQRIRLASQIGSGLSGVLYVLDEPSIGLHQRDNKKLISTLKHLRDLGNTVIVVEHDREMMEDADIIVDFGPGAGSHGGTIVAQGTPQELMKNPKSLTGKYLSLEKQIVRPKLLMQNHPIPENNRFIETNDVHAYESLTMKGATENNLKNLTVSLPLSKFICVTGVSGSGKSSLIVDTLYPGLAKTFNPYFKDKPGKYTSLEGTSSVDKVILIDQSPIGRTPRSNPATYTGVFTYIRDLFAQMPEAKARGYTAGRFSFNVKGGRCEACEGEGQKRIEMQFLSDVFVTCEVCHGTRYNQETLDVFYKEKTIAEVLALSIHDAIGLFEHQKAIRDKLQTLDEVGLGYMQLGQPATMLSGGEAQRVKLAAELSKRATGKTVYILDEPTTGLHFADLEKLLHVLHTLVRYGNTVIVIEHNLDIIKNADWIIDMGPEGGDDGGRIIAIGTPADVAKNKDSFTGQYLTSLI